jgi:hypothetical protein
LSDGRGTALTPGPSPKKPGEGRTASGDLARHPLAQSLGEGDGG